MTKAKVTSKGQITIPKEIRELLGLHPGDQVVFRPTEAGIVVEASTIDLLTLKGALKPKAKGVTVDDMKEAIRRRKRA
ncbi:MAG TPA: AbrB/MazE/SpoVT family DNA-binding domain-containing protein [Planctomycetota bacterium]|nr:AbrB/MazE/SpoVT family DNA-binding domain-containing protein [Planctomycetota bacterium]